MFLSISVMCALRTGGATKTDEFSEKTPKEGGGRAFSIQKFMLLQISLNRAV